MDAGMTKENTIDKKSEVKTNLVHGSSAEVVKTDGMVSTKSGDKKQRPGKLDITAAKVGFKNSAENEQFASETAKASSKAKAANTMSESSQPPTPGTAVSQASVTSVVRQNQPRTIRIPPAPKAEPSSPGHEPPTKSASRRPSFNSAQQPGTPVSERMSDNMSFTSTTMSRANSPPPPKIGTAPVRQVTKNQQKKERQARAKQAEGSSKVPEPAMKFEEVQAPIIGRKKKAKKEATQGTADSTPTATRPTSPVSKEDAVEEKATSGPVTPAKEPKKGASKVVADSKETDTPSSPATPANNEQQKASLTQASVVASLLKSGEIPTTAADLFKNTAPGLNHRFETIESDLFDIEPPSADQIRLLDQGEAIHLEKSANNNVVILPDRRQIPGFTAAQASRYIELRKKALSDGGRSSTQAFEGLFVASRPTNVQALNPAGQRDPKMKKLNNKFETPAARSDPIIRRRYGFCAELSEESVLLKKPTMTVSEAEQHLAAQRKDTEALEKKLGGLLKRNRRLVFGNAH